MVKNSRHPKTTGYPLQSFFIKLEANLRCELDNTLDQIEALWFQKSLMEAIKDGDKNTRYYHLSTNHPTPP